MTQEGRGTETITTTTTLPGRGRRDERRLFLAELSFRALVLFGFDFDFFPDLCFPLGLETVETETEAVTR